MALILFHQRKSQDTWQLTSIRKSKPTAEELLDRQRHGCVCQTNIIKGLHSRTIKWTTTHGWFKEMKRYQCCLCHPGYMKKISYENEWDTDITILVSDITTIFQHRTWRENTYTYVCPYHWFLPPFSFSVLVNFLFLNSPVQFCLQ